MIEGGNLFLYDSQGSLKKTVNLTDAHVNEQNSNGGQFLIIKEGNALDSSVVLETSNTLTDLVTGSSGLSLEDLTRATGWPVDPAGGAFDITPSDVANLSRATRSLYVGTGGDLRVTTVYGDDVTFSNVNSGQVLPVRAIRVWSTSTTATDILGLY
jgi:hypothetical protein